MKNVITTVVLAVALTGLSSTVFAADVKTDPQTNQTPTSENETDNNKADTSNQDDAQAPKSDEDGNKKTGMGGVTGNMGGGL